MVKIESSQQKYLVLKQNGTFNLNHKKVIDQLFSVSDFFDACDVVQVKYEMVRRVRIDGQTVSQSAAIFGFSRPSFYRSQVDLDNGGLMALLPQKHGPRRSHKLDTFVMEFIQKHRLQNSSINISDLASLVLRHFGFKVHPRSIARAIMRQEKKSL